VIHFTVEVWDEVMQLTIVNYLNTDIHINLIQKLPQTSVLKKRMMTSKDWIQQSIEEFDFSSVISIGTDRVMCCISGDVKSYDDCQDGKSSNMVEEGDRHEPDPVQSFTKCCCLQNC